MDDPPEFLQFEPGTIVKLTGGTLDIGVIYEVPLEGWRRMLYRFTRIARPKRSDMEEITARLEEFREEFQDWTP